MIPSRWNFTGTSTPRGGTRKPSVDRLVEVVEVRRDTALEVEEVVGVDVDLVLRRRGQADEEAVEVVEDRAVLLVDGAVRLVDDDEVEVADAEATRAVRTSLIRPIIVG